MKRVVRRVEIPYQGKPYDLELSSDPELAEDAKYVFHSFNALAALGKMPQIPKAKFKVYSTRFPQYAPTAHGKYFSALIAEDPDHSGDFMVMIDERLEPHERLAALAHEFGHVVGGYHTSDKSAQKNALKDLTLILQGYDTLADPHTSEVLSRETGIDFNAGRKSRGELKQSIEYLTKSGEIFGVTERDWEESGLKVMHSAQKKKRLEGMLSIIFVLLGSFILFANALPITGNAVWETTFDSSYSVFLGTVLFLIGLLMFFASNNHHPQPQYL